MAKSNENKQETVVNEEQIEQKYSLESLRENCSELFGVSKAYFDGAVYGLDIQEYSISEMKEIIDKWGKKEAR